MAGWPKPLELLPVPTFQGPGIMPSAFFFAVRRSVPDELGPERIAGCGMTATPVIEHFHVFKQAEYRPRMYRITPPVTPFFLHVAKESLCWRAVQAILFVTHRARNLVLRKFVLKLLTAVPASTIQNQRF